MFKSRHVIAVAALLLTGPALSLADAGKPVLLAQKKDKKAAEEEAAKKAAEEEAAKKAAEEEAAKKAAEEEAAKKAAEEEAAKKAAEEEAAKKAASDKGAKSEVTTEEDDAAEGEDNERGFRQKYIPFWVDDKLSPYAKDKQWMFILLTFGIGLVLPFSELWLPLVMWEPKPKFDAGALLKPYLIHYGLQVAGHVALFVPYILCIPGWSIFYIPMLIAQVAWAGFMAWSMKLVMLQAWDDLMTAQNGGTPLEVQEPAAKGASLKGVKAPLGTTPAAAAH
jgi:hypothetical protein